ncbi:MAG: hypothetical protein QOH52_786 [Pseudonocardiales bacterium]|nr:hypothetical protein [Pseudonocardiales bacterium]
MADLGRGGCPTLARCVPGSPEPSRLGFIPNTVQAIKGRSVGGSRRYAPMITGSAGRSRPARPAAGRRVHHRGTHAACTGRRLATSAKIALVARRRLLTGSRAAPFDRPSRVRCRAETYGPGYALLRRTLGQYLGESSGELANDFAYRCEHDIKSRSSEMQSSGGLALRIRPAANRGIHVQRWPFGHRRGFYFCHTRGLDGLYWCAPLVGDRRDLACSPCERCSAGQVSGARS